MDHTNFRKEPQARRPRDTKFSPCGHKTGASWIAEQPHKHVVIGCIFVVFLFLHPHQPALHCRHITRQSMGVDRMSRNSDESPSPSATSLMDSLCRLKELSRLEIFMRSAGSSLVKFVVFFADIRAKFPFFVLK